MTKRELLQLEDLGREIKQSERRLSQLAALESGLRAWPFAEGFGASEKLGLERQLSGCRREVYIDLQLRLLEFKRLQRFISTLDDSLIRQILTGRYAEGKNWTQVAFQVGGGNTPDSVRKTAERFLMPRK